MKQKHPAKHQDPVTEYSGGELRGICRSDEGAGPHWQGFGLLEMMIALLVLTFGLLSAGQMLFVAAASASLARSKGTAAIAAQDVLESLGDLYRRNPMASDLALGYHGPEQIEIVNPVDAGTLNRYRIEWDVGPVPDSRPGRMQDAKLVTVTIVPSLSGGNPNNRPGLNKTLNVSTIFSARNR